ncbi:MAG: ribonuclease III, partial [Betaproteobacteria bacterium]|nr:ribonuclease III [Betaproteobacteria bacterium]
MDTGSLERALGYRFANPQLLVQALTHRSFGSPHNERLEFLGDSVLNFVVAWELFREFERSREGDLSRLRASLVRQETLHRLADALQLGNFLALGEGELKSGGFRRPSILADALEAIFGAVLLDGGFEAARSAVLRLYQPLLEGIDPRQSLKDPKTALQEWL